MKYGLILEKWQVFSFIYEVTFSVRYQEFWEEYDRDTLKFIRRSLRSKKTASSEKSMGKRYNMVTRVLALYQVPAGWHSRSVGLLAEQSQCRHTCTRPWAFGCCSPVTSRGRLFSLPHSLHWNFQRDSRMACKWIHEACKREAWVTPSYF